MPLIEPAGAGLAVSAGGPVASLRALMILTGVILVAGIIGVSLKGRPRSSSEAVAVVETANGREDSAAAIPELEIPTVPELNAAQLTPLSLAQPPSVDARRPLPEVAPRPPSAPARSMGSPTLVVDLGGANPVAGRNPGAGPAPTANGAGGVAAADPSVEQMALGASAAGETDRVLASRLRNPSIVVAQGAIVPAVLETAIDSDLPGFARAAVTLDVYSFDGENLLIPKGSRLIGQYKSDLIPGQSRVFVAWTRLIRPDGATVQLSSPATDTLGRNGLEGKVDRRLFERFGAPALFSSLSAALNSLSNTGSSQIILGSTVNSSPSPGAKAVSPVVRIQQGSAIRIFVARDLDFSPVGAVTKRARILPP